MMCDVHSVRCRDFVTKMSRNSRNLMRIVVQGIGCEVAIGIFFWISWNFLLLEAINDFLGIALAIRFSYCHFSSLMW